MKRIIDIDDEWFESIIASKDHIDKDDEAYLILNSTPYEERPQGECKSCRHRDPEDKKCDCGAIKRQGCPFPVSDDYYCKHYEKGGAE